MRALDDGQLIPTNWQPIIEVDVFRAVQAKLDANSVNRRSRRATDGHLFLLEGLVRCGACGAAMTHASGTGRGGQVHYYYACSGRQRTAGTRCSTRSVPADRFEQFIIDLVGRNLLDEHVLQRAVAEANGSRTDLLARFDADERRMRAALAEVTSSLKNMITMCEAGSAPRALLEKITEREAERDTILESLRVVAVEREATAGKTVNGGSLARNFQTLLALISAARANGAHAEVRRLLRALVHRIDWSEDAANPDAGTADIELFDLPPGLFKDGLASERGGAAGVESEQPHGVVGLSQMVLAPQPGQRANRARARPDAPEGMEPGGDGQSQQPSKPETQGPTGGQEDDPQPDQQGQGLRGCDTRGHKVLRPGRQRVRGRARGGLPVRNSRPSAPHRPAPPARRPRSQLFGGPVAPHPSEDCSPANGGRDEGRLQPTCRRRSMLRYD